MARPPGKNYLENCIRTGRTPDPEKLRLVAQKYGHEAITREKEVNPPPAEAGQDARLLTLAKSSFFQMASASQLKGKEPVRTRQENEWVSEGVILRSVERPRLEQLRNASRTASLIGAIHKKRIDEYTAYLDFDDEELGLDLRLIEKEKAPSKKDETLMEQAREFFRIMGDRNDGWSKRVGMVPSFQMAFRDSLAIDINDFWLRRNRFGKVIEIRYVDPGTIFEIDPEKGFRGNKKVGWVQIVDGEIVRTFEPDEIRRFHMNHQSDVRMYGTGISPVEVCFLDVWGVVNALKYNRQRFSNNPPPGFISVLGTVAPDDLELLNQQWANIWSNNENNFEIPVMSSEAQIQWNALNMPTDVQFEKLMQWLASLVLAAHGMQPEELGLRLSSSQSLSEPNADGRIQNAISTARKAALRYYSSVFNGLKDHLPEFESLRFYFRGMNPRDRDREINHAKDESSAYRTIDEVRALQGLPSLGEEMIERYKLKDEQAEAAKFAGAVIRDAQWMQAGVVQKLMPQQEQEAPQTGDGGMSPIEGGDEDDSEESFQFDESDLLGDDSEDSDE